MQVNRPDVLAEVNEVFGRYEAALVSNDLSTLTAMFWDSPLAVRYGDGQGQYGYEAIAAFRKDRPADDLERDLETVVITTFGADVATTAAEFRRAASGARGRQMQTWVRTDEGWRIVAAHISLP